MDRIRHRKSKSATAVEESRQIPKPKSALRLSSDSRCYSDGTAKGDVFMHETGHSSFRRVNGTPMKKLLAEEMQKETETKRRSSSVIARLIGFDGVGSMQHLHRQQRRLSDSYQQRAASFTSQKNEQVLEGRSRRSSMDRQEFKDVYEDLEASHVTNHRYSSRWSADSRLTKHEMELIHRRSIEAKRLSTDGKRQSSKELRDKPEMLDQKDILLEYLQQPDSLFIKHLRDSRINSSSSLCSHITVLKPSNCEKFESNAKPWKSEIDGICEKHLINSRWKRKDGCLLHSQSHHSAHDSRMSPNKQLEKKDEKDKLPTKIVVLKPSFRKMLSDMTSVSSRDSSQTYLPQHTKHAKHTNPMTREGGSSKSDPSDASGPSRRASREAREIAKRITNQMKDSIGDFPRCLNNLTNSRLKGYAGDESSNDMYESDSTSETEVIPLSVRNSHCWSNRHRSKSRYGESSLSKEAKKRLSERWKISQKYQHANMINKGSTLGEMLATAEEATRNADEPTVVDLAVSETSAIKGIAGHDGPLNISSSDGWKDGGKIIPSRSRSLSPSFSGGSSGHKTSVQNEALADGLYQMPREPLNPGGSKGVTQHVIETVELSSADVSPASNKTQPDQDTIDDVASSLEASFGHMQAETNPEEGESDHHHLDSPNTIKDDSTTSSAADEVNNAGLGEMTILPESSVELLLEAPAPAVSSGDSSCDMENEDLQELPAGPSEQNDVPLQSPGVEPETSESSKEIDHPSPDSVLEVSSRPECFKLITAGLQGLRMDLQLLRAARNSGHCKSDDSEACTEVSNLSLVNEENAHQEVLVFEEEDILTSDSWELSYIVDVLIDSGFKESDPDMFIAKWHSPESPLDPLVFDSLEKKYSDEITGTRSERRLLFDRINSALLEILQLCLDPCPWLKPATRIVNQNWTKHWVEENVQKFMEDEESEAYGYNPQKVLDKEMEWIGFRNDIDMIGKEIEKLMVDDLIEEVVSI